MNLAQFRQQIAQSFNLTELEQLAFGLGMDWDELKGFTKSAKIQALISHCQRRQQLPALIASLRQERPERTWPDAAALAAALTTATPSGPQQRNRQNILNNIHHTWIEGVLKPALHNDVALSLSLSYQPNALNRPHRSLYPEEQLIPPDTSLGQIFATRGRSLLILGGPASGKTIALLQLLQELLAAAQADPSQPIPIVLNLSSWARERTALTDWIVEELLVQYQAARQVSRDWLAANQLTLLLDGLDEVAAEQREACVAAINTFKADHPVDIAVCSRLADYKQLQARLNLSTAIRIQPLTPIQIDDYLASFGTPLANLRQAVAADEEWRELAQSPLMLNLMAYAYNEAALLPEVGALADKRRQLLATYVQRTRQNRPLPPDSPYDEAAALRWVYNIATQLQIHTQSIFYIEYLQPTWLPKPSSYLLWSRLIGLLFAGLIGLTFGRLLLGTLGVFVGLSTMVVIISFFRLVDRVSTRDNLTLGLAEQLHWSRPSRSMLWQNVKEGFLMALLVGPFFGIFIGLFIGLTIGLIPGLIVGLASSLLIGLTVCFGVGSQAFIQASETHNRSIPNQGIRESLHSARRTGLIIGLILGLVLGVFARLVFRADLGFVFGLVFGLSLGLLQYGGQTVLQHYILRWLLARQGMLPFPFRDRDLIAYLDAMAARLLLRRVGGGWMFIHRTLLEFLADEAEFQKLINDL